MNHWPLVLLLLVSGCASLPIEEAGRQAGKGLEHYCKLSPEAREESRTRFREGMQATCPGCSVTVTCPAPATPSP